MFVYATMYNEHASFLFALYKMSCILQLFHCEECSILCFVLCFFVCSVQCAFYNVQCAVFSLQCAICSVKGITKLKNNFLP